MILSPKHLDLYHSSVFEMYVLIECLFSYEQVPEKKLKLVMADKELYKVCAVEVKRQIWQENQALFGDEVSPLLKQYIVAKEAALFSSDLSILHNFFSPSPKARRQGEVSHPSTSGPFHYFLTPNRFCSHSNKNLFCLGSLETDPDDWEECETI